MVIVNLSGAVRTVSLAQAAQSSVLTAANLDARVVDINGKRPTLALLKKANIQRDYMSEGTNSVPAYSISFLEFDGARNVSCK